MRSLVTTKLDMSMKMHNIHQGLAGRIRAIYTFWRNWLHHLLWAADIQDRMAARIHRCRSIVDFSFAMGKDEGTIRSGDAGLSRRLALRARANQHLVDVLGINNSLTTADPSTHIVFLRKATQRIGRMATAQHWRELYGHCRELLEQAVAPVYTCISLQQINHGLRQVPLAVLVRRLCLEMVLWFLFRWLLAPTTSATWTQFAARSTGCGCYPNLPLRLL